MSLEVSASDIGHARERLAGNALVTPVRTAGWLDRNTGSSIYLKCENMQRVGAFKFRGAFNALSRHADSLRQTGVITFSSGNHAQAIAKAGSLLGISTTIVMPDDAPRVKYNACRQYGGQVIEYSRSDNSRESVAEQLRQDQPMTLIPPFDHVDVIAGQGTASAELFDQIGQLDALVVPCGGGGLLSGAAIAAKAANPACKVYGVEPETADDGRQSFHAGTIVTIDPPHTIADGVRTPSLGEITFKIIRSLVDDMVTVSEAEIVNCVRDLFIYSKMVVEPSGAVGLAAVVNNRIHHHQKIGVILSGGNIEPAVMAGILLDAPD